MTTTIITLPLFSDKKYRYSASLEGVARVLQFYWNSRAELWHMDVFDERLDPLLLGIALVPQYPIIGNYAMKAQELTGYFALMPMNLEQAKSYSEEMTVVPQFFEFLYVTTTSEDEE